MEKVKMSNRVKKFKSRLEKELIGTIVHGYEIMGVEYTTHSGYYLRYKCLDCGNTRIKEKHLVLRGEIRKCRCKNVSRTKAIHEEAVIRRSGMKAKHGIVSYKDLSGLRFGKLVVIKFVGTKQRSNGTYAPLFKCKCDCGNIVIAKSSYLTSKHEPVCKKEVSAMNRLKAINTNKKKKAKREAQGIKAPVKRNRSRSATKYSKTIRYKYSNVCQKCKTYFEDKDLNAHHIKQYACNPNVRTLVSNGVLLCTKCHEAFHMKYGYNVFDTWDTFEFIGVERRKKGTSL